MKYNYTSVIIELTLSVIYTLSDAFAAEDFWKHWEIAQNEQCVLLPNYVQHCSVIMLSFIDLPYFCLDVYKVVCCRFVVCGKGLRLVYPNVNTGIWKCAYNVIGFYRKKHLQHLKKHRGKSRNCSNETRSYLSNNVSNYISSNHTLSNRDFLQFQSCLLHICIMKNKGYYTSLIKFCIEWPRMLYSI